MTGHFCHVVYSHFKSLYVTLDLKTSYKCTFLDILEIYALMYALIGLDGIWLRNLNKKII